jgi:hypothetical protein
METKITVPVTYCPCGRVTTETDTFCAYCGIVLPLMFQNPGISGHTSPETAYLVDDYPYGFRLRCSIRYWIEYKKNHGFRFASQTSNPKKPGTVWNKPKYSTYSTVIVMTKDDRGHIYYAALSGYDSERTIQAFADAYGEHFTDQHRAQIRDLTIVKRAQQHITYTVRSAGTYSFNYTTGKLELDPDSEGADIAHLPRQSHAEQAAIMARAIGYEEARMNGEIT